MDIVKSERTDQATTLTRRSLLAGLGATFAAPTATFAGTGANILRDTRRLFMVSIHTGEQIDITYCRKGKYDRKAIAAINHFMRDWRTGEEIEMDIRGIDLWSDLHSELETSHPFQLISGYRSPKTNNMLRNRSSGVAKKSYHMSGMAADLRLPDRSLRQIGKVARKIGAGGIGIYDGSNFIHVDTGKPRNWLG